MQFEIYKHMLSQRWVFYHISETSQYNMNNHKTAMNESRGLSNNLKPEQRKTTIWSTVDPTIDNSSRAPSIWNRISVWEPAIKDEEIAINHSIVNPL